MAEIISEKERDVLIDEVSKSVQGQLKDKLVDYIKQSDYTKSLDELKTEMQEMHEKHVEEVRLELIADQAKQKEEAEVAKAEWVKNDGGEYVFKTENPEHTQALAYKAYYDYQRNKAIATTAATVGGLEDPGVQYVSRDGLNAWRQDISVQSYGAVTEWIALKLTNWTMTKASATSSDLSGLTVQGTGSEVKNGFDEWNAIGGVSRSALSDVPGYATMFERAGAMADMKTKGTEISSAIKTSVAAGTAGTNLVSVTSGTAKKNPTTGAVLLQKMRDMMAKVGGDYHDGAVWHVSRSLYSLLLSATSGTNGEYAFDQMSGARMLYGYPLRINDRLTSAPTADDDLLAVFGDLSAAVVLGERTDLSMVWNPYIKHNNTEVHVQSRFKPVILDVGTASSPSACGLIAGA